MTCALGIKGIHVVGYGWSIAFETSSALFELDAVHLYVHELCYISE